MLFFCLFRCLSTDISEVFDIPTKIKVYKKAWSIGLFFSFRILFCFSLIGIKMHIFMSLCNWRVTNLYSHKAPSIMWISVKDVVLLWTRIIYPHITSRFESREIFRTQGILEFSNSNCSVLTLVFRYIKGGTWHYRSRERVYRSWSNRAVAS